ncbi:hypothetical protein VNO77_40566 [Canavalia gladiata]|uniref:Uncharacterized protein n=1 Tax=Canavalia gladiata TaxID=3824 RepID=A0AAN9K031_CANGL
MPPTVSIIYPRVYYKVLLNLLHQADIWDPKFLRVHFIATSKCYIYKCRHIIPDFRHTKFAVGFGLFALVLCTPLFLLHVSYIW